VDPLAIIADYYRPGTPGYDLLLDHSRRVCDKALAVATRLQAEGMCVDTRFVEEAALLHDIGIFGTLAPRLHCRGTLPYVCHGVVGRNMLDSWGYPRHALVCERHVGVGLEIDDIVAQGLPLPLRAMVPIALEEEIICYADKFFSKNRRGQAHAPAEILADIGRYGNAKLRRFEAWHARFGAI
jgi:uncharacterized protein